MKTLQREAQTGLRRLRGTHVTGSIPLKQSDVNDLLKSSAAGQSAHVEFRGGNRIVVHYSAFHIEAVLAESLDAGASPTVSVTLASTLVAWTLKWANRLPYVRIDGRRVTIDLAGVPAFGAYRELLMHIKAATFTTTPGNLTVNFEILIA